jgi:hypothetical protein
VGDCILIAIAIIIIHETGHSDDERFFVRDGVVGGSVGVLIVGIDKDTTVEIPYRRGGFATLARSKHLAVIAVLIITRGYAHLRLDTVHGMLEHGTLNCGNVTVKSEGATDNASEVDNNSVITGSSVVGKLKVAEAE